MKKATFHAIAGLLALGLAFGVNFAQAQAGTLDPTFGKGGTVTANLGITATTLTAFEQSNGNIAVVTGLNKTSLPGVEGFALLRYTSSGKLLSKTTATFFANGDSMPVAAAMQSNGEIVVAGTTTGTTAATEFALARFWPTGHDFWPGWIGDDRSRGSFSYGICTSGPAQRPDIGGRVCGFGSQTRSVSNGSGSVQPQR